MATELNQKLQLALNSKESLKEALINKGANITDDTTFAQYASKVKSMIVPSGFSYSFSMGSVYGGEIFSICPGDYLLASDVDVQLVITCPYNTGEINLYLWTYTDWNTSTEKQIDSIRDNTTHTYTFHFEAGKGYGINFNTSGGSIGGIEGTVILS